MLNFAPAYPSRSDLDWCYYLRRQGRAGDAMERVLHDIGAMHPGGWSDWRPSTLTMTGAPVELSFTAKSDGLRLTTEVADPGSDPTGRVGLVCRVIADLGGTPPPTALRDVISAAQSTGDLRYGAWLGLRHGPGGLSTKLYAELPAAATDLADLMSPEQFGPVPQIPGPHTRVKMLGYDCTTGTVEMYYATKDALRTVLPTLAAPAGIAVDLLEAAIDGLTDLPQHARMPTRDLGFSYGMVGPDQPPVLTLYFVAQALFGTDAKISDRIDACYGDRTPKGYKSLLDHLPPAPAGQTHHGMVGLTARQGKAPSMSIGVAAPWASPYDPV